MTKLAIFPSFFGFFHFQTFAPIFSDAHFERADGRVETKVGYAFFIFSFLLKVGIFRNFSKFFNIDVFAVSHVLDGS